MGWPLFFEILSLLSSIVSFYAATRLIWRGEKNPLTFSLVWIGISAGIYSFFYALMFAVDDLERVRVFYRLSAIGWGGISCATGYFFHAFVNFIKEKKKSPPLLLYIIPALVLTYYGVTGKLLAQGFRLGPMGWIEFDLYSHFSTYIYLAIFCILIVACTILLLILRKKLMKAMSHVLIRLILLPFMAAWILSIFSNLLSSFFPNWQLPALAHFWISWTVVIASTAALRWRVLSSSPHLVAKDLLSLMTDICIITDLEDRVLEMSKQGKLFFGIDNSFKEETLSLDGFIGTSLIIPPDKDVSENSILLRGKTGNQIVHWYVFKRLYNHYGMEVGRFFIANDIQDIYNLRKVEGKLKTDNRHLKRLAERDFLTGIYNRTKITDALEKSLKKKRSEDENVSVILMDIDDFKAINDTWGHEKGDEILIRVTSAMQEELRDGDILGRWGGEEFLIVCGSGQSSNAVILAERLQAVLEGIDHGLDRLVTMSFGVASQMKDDDIKSLVARADEALYSAKRGGKNMVVSSKEIL